MNKNITRYHESKDLLVCSFEIIDLKKEDIDQELKIIKENFSEKEIEMLVVVEDKVKCELWISDLEKSWINQVQTAFG